MEKKTVLTPYQQEQAATLKKIKEYKLNAEASAVALIYKNPDLLDTCDLTIDDISSNVWKVGFAIAIGLRKEGVNTLSEIDVGMYCDKHLKLKAKFEEYGGYATFKDAGVYVDEKNFDGFVAEIKKWNCVIQLLTFGFPVSEKLSQYADMTAEQIYQELDGYVSHVFANADSKIKSYDVLTGYDALIDEMNQGAGVGMPIEAPLLNAEIGGLQLGNIYSITASSGTGKSAIINSYVITACIKYKRKVVMFVNEEDEKRVKKDLLIWACSNVLNKPVSKRILRDGKYDEDTLNTLRQAGKWLEQQDNDHLITVVPLEHYTCATVIKLMHKYKNLFGCDLFIIDTFKESSDAREEAWKSMLDDSVSLYNCIKSVGLNCTLVLTMQLAKGSIKNRHLTNMDIGQSKSVVDVFSVSLFVRRAEPDELEGGDRELQCFRLEGKNKKTKIPFTMSADKYWYIWFIAKNRFGRTDVVSIVTEADLSTNKFTDVGYCVVPDFNM